MTFVNLIDLASEALGGRALACTDDFFASMHNLVKPGRGAFDPDRYTDRGKWMDGWESRRRRGPGHDHCTLALGAPGRIRALDIDTNHFLGNHPPFASLEAASLAPGAPLEAAEWVELVPASPLRPGSQNLFTCHDARAFTHVRLHLYPDGGVARLRVWGEVQPRLEPPALDEVAAQHVAADAVDLAAVVNGGKALGCSDAFFGPMDNLLLPGRAQDMGGGWETRRRRPTPGHDWIVIRLGARGRLSVLEVDTNHFKGNFPERVALHGIDGDGGPGAALFKADAPFEVVLEPVALRAHERRFLPIPPDRRGPFTHLRFDVFPDGGVSRLRAWGHPA